MGIVGGWQLLETWLRVDWVAVLVVLSLCVRDKTGWRVKGRRRTRCKDSDDRDSPNQASDLFTPDTALGPL